MGPDAAQPGQPAAPVDCPECNCPIELRGDTWVCRGAQTLEEVERYLAPHLPSSFGRTRLPDSMPSCGWTGRAADFGVTWS